jgi:hypothetical protein
VYLGQWHYLKNVNGHATTKNKDIKDDFHEELE